MRVKLNLLKDVSGICQISPAVDTDVNPVVATEGSTNIDTNQASKETIGPVGNNSNYSSCSEAQLEPLSIQEYKQFADNHILTDGRENLKFYLLKVLTRTECVHC